MVPEGGSELFEGGAEQIVPEPVGRGLPRVRTPVRNQVAVPWLTLDELLPPDHRARSVWSFVEKLELSALYRAIKAVEGRGPVIRLVIRTCWWRCGCTRPWSRWGAPACWRGCVGSTWAFAGCVAG